MKSRGVKIRGYGVSDLWLHFFFFSCTFIEQNSEEDKKIRWDKMVEVLWLWCDYNQSNDIPAYSTSTNVWVQLHSKWLTWDSGDVVPLCWALSAATRPPPLPPLQLPLWEYKSDKLPWSDPIVRVINKSKICPPLSTVDSSHFFGGKEVDSV